MYLPYWKSIVDGFTDEGCFFPCERMCARIVCACVRARVRRTSLDARGSLHAGEAFLLAATSPLSTVFALIGRRKNLCVRAGGFGFRSECAGARVRVDARVKQLSWIHIHAHTQTGNLEAVEQDLR